MTASTVSPSATAQRHVEHCMGTVFSIDVRAPGVDAAAIERVVAWLRWVDATFSTYRPDSQISRLDAGALRLADCAPEVRDVLAQCDRLRDETGGYFDCRGLGHLDPSGYVKGWAIERASDLLEDAGSLNHCVNGGGDVQCVGAPAPGRHWQIGIADPSRRGATVAAVSGNRIAVATSGSAERGRHIVDPHSRLRPDAFAAVTVVGERLADVDAYATSAFAMGEAAPSWLQERGLRALLIRPDGTAVITPSTA